MKNLTWVKEEYALLIMRCVAESFCLQIKSSKKQQIIKIDGRKASFCEIFRFAQHDKSLATLERDLG